MTPQASILISSYNRTALLRRTLWSIAERPPSVPFEVVLADEGSTEDTLAELERFSGAFPWTFIRVDIALFERETGIKKFFNNPALTANIAFKHARGRHIFQQGNEVIAWGAVYDRLLSELPASPRALALSSTLDLPPEVLDSLDDFGANLHAGHIRYAARWPLASPVFHTDVTNYISLSTRQLWEDLGGYDERYVRGIGKEDSDFVRRARAIPGWTDASCLFRSEALSLHQYHGGRTWHYLPKPEVITQERWKEGEALSKEVWDAWDGGHKNTQPWPWGCLGVTEVIRHD